REMWEIYDEASFNGRDWRSLFDRLGGSILTGLRESSEEFAKALEAGLTAAGGIRNTRVTFRVSSEHYSIALEAIRAPVPHIPEPWIIHAPFLRAILPSSTPLTSLFSGEPRRLRALIVCADTSGFVDGISTAAGQVVKLNRLKYVAAECRAV